MSLGANVELDESSAMRHVDDLDGADVVIAQATVCQTGNKKIFELARQRGGPERTYLSGIYTSVAWRRGVVVGSHIDRLLPIRHH